MRASRTVQVKSDSSGIESFCGDAGQSPASFHGVNRNTRSLQLKETEFRFNLRNDNAKQAATIHPWKNSLRTLAIMPLWEWWRDASAERWSARYIRQRRRQVKRDFTIYFECVAQGRAERE
jgi:hypothetical protein